MHAMEVRGDRRVPLLSAATAFLFLFSLLGLATHRADDAAAQQVSAAAEATTRTGTATLELRVAVRTATIDNTVTGTGAIDFAAGRASLTLVTPGRRPIDLVIDGETVYQRDGNLPAVPGGKPWTTMPANPMAGMSPALGGNGGDPLATLRMLQDEGLLRDVRHVGSDEVGGVRAAKYTAAIDADKVRDRMREARPELAALMQAMRFNHITMATWISDDGLLRRAEVTTAMKVRDQSFEMSISFELGDFGAPVTIEVPPADQVVHPVG